MNFKKIICVLAITSAICTSNIYAQTANIAFVGGQIEISGSIDKAEPDVLVTAIVLDKGKTKEDFFGSSGNFAETAKMVHTFWQTTTKSDGSFFMSIPLKSTITLDNYVVLVDSTAFTELKSQIVAAVGADTIKSILSEMSLTTDQAQMSNLLIYNAAMFGINTVQYAAFSATDKKIINDAMMALDLSGSDIYVNVNKVKNEFNTYFQLVLFNNEITEGGLVQIIENTGNILGLDVTVFNQLDKMDFAKTMLGNDYTSIEKLQQDFLEKSILKAFNTPVLAGTLKTIVENYTSIISVDVSENSDYQKVSGAQLFKKVIEGKPFSSISAIKTEILDAISSIKTTPTPLDSTEGDRKSSGGGGSGKSSSYVVAATPVPAIAPAPVPSKPVKQQQKDFADTQNHWAKAYISEMSEKGYVNGIDETHFRPDNSITRAEFVSIMARMLSLDKADKTFADVIESDWFYNSVNAAAKAGLISVSEQFRPNHTITRQEIFKIVVNAYEYKTGTKVQGIDKQFADDNQIESWAKDYANAAAELNIVTGIEKDGKYYIKPTDNASRAEAVVMLKRLIDIIK